MLEQSGPMHRAVRRVLGELESESLLRLARRLEVMVKPQYANSVWAYYPDFRGLVERKNLPVFESRWLQLPDTEWRRLAWRDAQWRFIVRRLRPKPETLVLLVFSAADFEIEPAGSLRRALRDQLGHVLVYLSDPLADNDCSDAMQEWRLSKRRSLRSPGGV